MRKENPNVLAFTSVLCPEAREDAGKIARQVWVKCYQLLGGQQYKMVMADQNTTLSIFGGDFLRDEILSLGIDLIVMRRKGNDRDETTDHLVFLPGHALTRNDRKNIGMQQLTDGRWNEMDRDELQEILEQLKKAETRNVPAERPVEEMGLI